MHIVLQRYLNLNQALTTLRQAPHAPLTVEEQAFVDVTHAHPEKRQALFSAQDVIRPAPETQQALLFLATHAAVDVLAQDETFGPEIERARATLDAEGASQDERELLLASLLIEEAFGFLSEDDLFDGEFFLETLQTLPQWACLTQERLQQWTEEFEATHPGSRTLIEQFFTCAWSDGPEPINPEHLEMLVGQWADEHSLQEAQRSLPTLRALIDFLHQERLLGPIRRGRLLQGLEELAPQLNEG